MLRLRSCASSMISVSYWRSIRSGCISASRMPSVISLTRVSLADLVGEAHLVADHVAQLGAQLLGDPLGHRAGGDPPGLGVPDQAVHAAAQLQADLGQLGGLAGAGLARHDHHLVVADGGGDVVLALADRQLRRVGDHGHRRPPGGEPLLGPDQVGGDLGQRRLPTLRVAQLAGTVEPPLEPALVAEHQRGEAAVQLANGIGTRRRRLDSACRAQG